MWTHLRKSRRTEIVGGFQLCTLIFRLFIFWRRPTLHNLQALSSLGQVEKYFPHSYLLTFFLPIDKILKLF